MAAGYGFAIAVASVNGREVAARPADGATAFDANEVALLQACVGFHAKAQSDPSIRSRLYQLWCKLDELKHAA